MSRDDSILYTGITSASKKVKAKREDLARSKNEQRLRLEPFADEILALIEKERAKIPAQIMSLVRADSTEQETKALLMSFRLNEAFIDNLKVSVDNVLRVRQRKTKEAGNE